MPFDGIVTKSVCNELNFIIKNGRIEKIYQPQNDEVLLAIHNNGVHYKLLLSASAEASRIHLTNVTKDNPAKAPNFCLVLRKYLQNGKIKDILQYKMDRIVEIYIDSANELGDITTKILVIEIMGKHSNIILLNSDRKVIDSIKHIDFELSRLREILPGRSYEYPATQDKLNPLDMSEEEINKYPVESLVDTFCGVSPFVQSKLTNTKDFAKLISYIKHEEVPSGCIIYNGEKLKDFYISSDLLNIESSEKYSSICETIDKYYEMKQVQNMILNYRSDLSRIANHALSKKKKALTAQEIALKQCENMEDLKLYGELITANIYKIKNGDEFVEVNNYYKDNAIIKIKLNASKTPAQNAQKYYKKYNKMKNTFEHAKVQIEEIKKEIDYLENLISEIELAKDTVTLGDIKIEMIEQGLIASSGKTHDSVQSEPYKYISSDGFEIYVGKNNKQNDYLSLRFAKPTDVWLHVQKMPSSHVVIRTVNGNCSDTALLLGARLCAYYSKARFSKNVTVDYTLVKYVDKPKGSKPGFVIYTNYKSVIVDPSQQ